MKQMTKPSNAKLAVVSRLKTGWDSVPYQSTHNTGGAVMGADPKTSAVNKYLQSWDVPNVFAIGASAFPQNGGHNPPAPGCAPAFHARSCLNRRHLYTPRPPARR